MKQRVATVLLWMFTIALTSEGDADRPELQQARRFAR